MVLGVLTKLHHLKWCHCDLRWPNIVYTYDGNAPLLIDFEYARKIGDPVPRDLKIIDGQIKNNKWDSQADVYQVGQMIITSNFAKDEDKRIAVELTLEKRSNAAELLDALRKLGGDWVLP